MKIISINPHVIMRVKMKRLHRKNSNHVLWLDFVDLARIKRNNKGFYVVSINPMTNKMVGEKNNVLS